MVAVIILLTDKNLQTDFGIHARYFIHWYGMLVIAIIALIAGAILLTSKKRSLGLAGTIGSAFIALFLVGDLATYSQVGFTSVSQFATYLFGVTKYPGSLSYIPGIYAMRAETLIGPDGVGTTRATLFDNQSSVGSSIHTLFVEPH